MKYSFATIGLAAGLFLAIAPNAGAIPINGTLNITGSVTVDDENIDWNPLGTGSGVFAVDAFSGGTGFFQALEGTSGTSLDLSLSTAGVGVPLNIMNFMTFDSAPGVSFTLTHISPGPYSAALCGASPAAGQTCSFPGSPFGLTNISADTSGVELFLMGTASDGSSSPISNWQGTYTAQFDQPYQELLDTVFVQGGSVENTYSATFTVTAVPEPATILLLGASLLALTFSRKRI